MRLIDKDALIDTLRYHLDCTYMSACTSVAECQTRRHEIQYCTNKVEQAIEIDAVPVVRGEWEVAIGYDPNKKVQCQNCYKMAYEPTPHCPNCGARMEDT